MREYIDVPVGVRGLGRGGGACGGRLREVAPEVDGRRSGDATAGECGLMKTVYYVSHELMAATAVAVGGISR